MFPSSNDTGVFVIERIILIDNNTQIVFLEREWSLGFKSIEAYVSDLCQVMKI